MIKRFELLVQGDELQLMKDNHNQINLFSEPVSRFSLPMDYEPVHPDYVEVSQIYLAKGNISTPERKQFVEGIFFLRGTASPDPGITMADIIRGVIPFIMLVLVGVALLVIFPEIIL